MPFDDNGDGGRGDGGRGELWLVLGIIGTALLPVLGYLISHLIGMVW